MKTVVLAFDSFKGCLSAADACVAAAAALPSGFVPVFAPLSDGGEGFVDAMCAATGAVAESSPCHGPLFEPIFAKWAVSPDGETAFVETAASAGLPLVPPEARDPKKTTSLGVGEIIAKASERGVRKILLGLGGSATNDGGMGVAAGLGVRFLDSEGKELPPIGESLAKVAKIDRSGVVNVPAIVCACDVRSPFFGSNGAAFVFAPQKGASPEAVLELDSGLRHFSEVLFKETGRDVSSLPGAGAAGGIGGGLMALFGATLEPGARLVFAQARLERKLSEAALLVTGEGCSDEQTLLGKAPAEIAALARAAGVPACLLSGAVRDRESLEKTFSKVVAATPPSMPLSEAIKPSVARVNIAMAMGALLQDF